MKPLKKKVIKDSPINLPWIRIEKETKIPYCISCLCLRENRKICNLYFNGVSWKDDGFDSNNTKTFNDVTHFVQLDKIKLPE